MFELSFTHSSLKKEENKSNERLEFLGDAILSSVVAEYLFKKFPYKNEGFLTEIRARIVKREMLNNIAIKVGIPELMQTNAQNSKYMLGNALEALIGAVFLDKGYNRCSKFVQDKLLTPYIHLEELVNSSDNFKSILLEWSDQKIKTVTFEVDEKKPKSGRNVFRAKVFIDKKPYGEGRAGTKKKAEQEAAKNACVKLGIE